MRSQSQVHVRVCLPRAHGEHTIDATAQWCEFHGLVSSHGYSGLVFVPFPGLRLRVRWKMTLRSAGPSGRDARPTFKTQLHDSPS